MGTARWPYKVENYSHIHNNEATIRESFTYLKLCSEKSTFNLRYDTAANEKASFVFTCSAAPRKLFNENGGVEHAVWLEMCTRDIVHICFLLRPRIRQSPASRKMSKKMSTNDRPIDHLHEVRINVCAGAKPARLIILACTYSTETNYTITRIIYFTVTCCTLQVQKINIWIWCEFGSLMKRDEWRIKASILLGK